MNITEKLITEWHPTKNGNLKLSDFTESSAKKVWWQCAVNPRHEWESRIFSRTKNGSNCPYCKGKKVLPEDSLALKYPELVLQWCCEKNGKLNPLTLSVHSGKKAWWRCDKGHEWETMICHRVSGGRQGKGTGCPYCSNQKTCKDNALETTDPGELKYWNYEKNTILPTDIVRGSRTKVWWNCSKASDHIWEASPYDKVVLGTGCPCCLGRKSVVSNCLATSHPEIAAEWHKSKNELTPYQVTYASNQRAWFTCSVDPTHEWDCKIYSRTTNFGQCPHCASSKGEKAIKEYFNKKNRQYTREYIIPECKNIRPLPFDFALFNEHNELLGLIEYQGIHHYMAVDWLGGTERLQITTRNDKIKLNYCQQNNIKLLRISYKRLSNINSILDDFLKSLSCTC